MKITIRREIQIQELLQEIREMYGSEEEIEKHLQENPDDLAASAALHNLREYRDADPSKRLTDTRTVFLSDSQLATLTSTRLELLFRLRQDGGEVEGIRALARLLDRDKKNVSEDVHSLAELGLLTLREQGPGRAHRIALPGEEIKLHLLEGGPQQGGPSRPEGAS